MPATKTAAAKPARLSPAMRSHLGQISAFGPSLVGPSVRDGAAARAALVARGLVTVEDAGGGWARYRSAVVPAAVRTGDRVVVRAIGETATDEIELTLSDGGQWRESSGRCWVRPLGENNTFRPREGVNYAAAGAIAYRPAGAS